jgi:hypothetical protein
MSETKNGFRTPEETWNKHMTEEARLDVIKHFFPNLILNGYGKSEFSKLPEKLRLSLEEKYSHRFQGFPYEISNEVQ